jgi:hypothetical protein
MADHIEMAALQALPMQPYATVRPTLKSGDLFFAAGTYFISQMIQKCTHSPWSHVGLMFVLPSIDRVMLLESVEDVGVRLLPLSKYLNDYDNAGGAYHGFCVVARPGAIREDTVQALAKFGLDELGRPYDTEEIADIAARIMLGISRAKANSRTYICSELVQACFTSAGLPFAPDPRGFISPENIWTSNQVTLLARIQ